ncbi:MAG: choice-of-anchor C family protein [Chloroflexota bacterium]|nr:MAG: choice-of-anchor C family protein [Chloroflexota bacterium]
MKRVTRLGRRIGAMALIVALVLGVVGAVPAAAAGPNLLTNGSFESGAFNAGDTNVLAGSTAITGWSVGGNGVDWIGPGIWTAADGSKSVDLNRSFAGTISQSFSTAPGATYTVTFDLAGNFTCSPAVKDVKASAGSTSVTFSFDSSGKTSTAMGWTQKNFSFAAVGASTTLTFASLTGGACGATIDNVSVVANNSPPTVGVNVTASNTVYYVDWTSASPGGGTASGVINLPGGQSVNVSFEARKADNSLGFYYGAQTGCGTNFWSPTAPYISTEVPTAPPNCELLQLSGTPGMTYKVTLSQPIVDPIMAIVSLGSSGTVATYDFDSPFAIVSQGVGFWGGCATCLTQQPGDVLRGQEGHGTIKFLGSFSTFSWTVPNPETWHGFTFAIRTTAALGNTNVLEGQSATNTGTWGDPDPGDSVTLSASAGVIVKNPDGTWNWSYATTDGPAQSQTVTITATDGNGGTATAQFPVTVNNVAPTAVLNAPASAVLGTGYAISLTAPSDPSSVDTGAGFQYAFDCGGGFGPYGAANNAACSARTLGTVTVKGKIKDKDGGESAYATTVNVIDNTPPVIIPQVSGTLGTNGWYVSDTTVSWSVTDQESAISASSGCGSSVVTTDTAAATFTCTATSAGGPASQSVTVKVDQTGPSATLAVVGGTLGSNGWYTSDVTVATSGTDSVSGPATCTANQTQTSETVGTTFNGACTNQAGLTTNAAPLTVKVDQTAPLVACTATSNSIWPPNHKLVNASVSVSVTDGASGSAGFVLTSVASDEPDNGLGDGDTAGDLQGWSVGSADTAGQVRAERSGTGDGRTYTLTYAGANQAGLTATCSTSIDVPHDRGR